ncbi:MAG: thioredoxin [Oscillospiraceae bacterium]|nr:thioredoxin [Oscillospiraceae bacterium]
MLRIVLLVLAALLIAEGVRNGSMAAVVNKAIRICTECVGLG